MKNKKNITDSIMAKITEDKIVPKARWEFLLKNYLTWVVGMVAVFVGGIATSGMIFVYQNSDWIMYKRLSGSFFEHAVSFVPILWTLLLVCFALLAIYQIKHTRRGYKYPITVLIGISILISSVFGLVLYKIGYAHTLDTRASRVLPLYEAIEEKREKLWVQPDRGLLAGVVLSTTTEDFFLFQDYSGETWEVSDKLLKKIDTFILSSVDEIGIVGRKTGTSSFEACAIRPWNIAGVNIKLREEMKQNMFEHVRYQKNLQMIHKVSPTQTTKAPVVKGVYRRIVGKDEFQNKLRQKGFVNGRLQDLRNEMCEPATTTQ